MIEKAVILAAGEGTRLRPFTESIPKVMLPVANKPILEYTIEALAKNGLRKIIIVVGYKKESIMNHFENGKKFGVEIKYEFQEKQLGTGHALLSAKKQLNKRFLILPGDNIIDADLISDILEQKTFSLLDTKHLMVSKYSALDIRKSNIKDIIEKPKEGVGNIISTGIYVLDKDSLNEIEKCAAEGMHDLTHAIQKMIKKEQKIKVTSGKGLWIEAVYPWDLLNLNEVVLKKCPSTVAGTIEDGVKIKGNVLIGKESIIRSGSYIVGPVVIGEGCEVGPNSCIFPSTSIGNNVSISPFSVIRHSIIMDDVWIGPHSSVSHSIVGMGNRFDANFTSIAGDADVKINKRFYGVVNIGCFIGDDCVIGGSTIIHPGKIIGKSCKINALNSITTNIESHSNVI